MRRRIPRGFTLMEMVTVLGIMVIVSLLALYSVGRHRTRATFNSFTAELQGVLHSARQEALGSGRDVVVLLFPEFEPLGVGKGGPKGRIIVVLDSADGATSLLNSASVNLRLETYNPATPMGPGANDSDTRGKLIEVLDLPVGVEFGPAIGLGKASLPFPYDSIETNVTCSFCSTGVVGWGAIVFDAHGRADFFIKDDPKVRLDDKWSGGSFSIYDKELRDGRTTATFSTATLVITRRMGEVRTFHNG